MSVFGSSPQEYYEMANMMIDTDLPMAGNCTSSEVTLDGFFDGTFAVNACTPFHYDPTSSWFWSCTRPAQRSFVSLRFLEGSSFTHTPTAHAAEEIFSTYEYKGFVPDSQYNWENKANECLLIYNDTAAYNDTIVATAKSYYVKAASNCHRDTATDYKFSVYSDSACTNKIEDYTMRSNVGNTYSVLPSSPFALRVSDYAFPLAVSLQCLDVQAPAAPPSPRPPTAATTPAPFSGASTLLGSAYFVVVAFFAALL